MNGTACHSLVCMFLLISVTFAPHIRAHDLGCKGEIELGELVFLFMIYENEIPSWRMQANNELICWLTDGIREEGDFYTRIGEVSVHVMGRRYSVLRQRLIPIPWIVKIVGSGPPKFPPDWVMMRPRDDCFEADGSKCDFELLPSLDAGGFSYEKLCENEEVMFGSSVVYRISYAGKKDAYLVYELSAGSWGYSNFLRLFWDMDSALFYGCEDVDFWYP